MSRQSDKSRPEFGLGPSADQVQRAARLLGDMELESFIEKRDLTRDYRTATLEILGRKPRQFDALMSLDPVDGQAYYVVLTPDQAPESGRATLEIKRPMGPEILWGRIAPAHPGFRRDDRIGDHPLMVSFFYPD